MGSGKGEASSASAQLRLASDLKQISQAPPEGCSASPAFQDSLFLWNATVFGPDDTPFEGGIFSLRLSFPKDYPSAPPAVRFVSECWHPNIYSDGSICLDILQDRWNPCHSVSTILTSIQSLLTDPNCASPANPEAANLYNQNRQEYNRRVRRCASRSLE